MLGQVRLPGSESEISRTLSMILDMLSVHVMVLTPELRIRYANEGARALISSGDGVVLRGSEIRFSDPRDNAILNDWVSSAATARLPHRARNRSLFTVHRPGNRRPFAGSAWRFPTSGKCGDSNSWSAVLFLVDPECAPPPRCMELGLLFDLSRREAEIALGLYDGLTLKETAKDLGIGINTAKTHLARVFEKTGVSRQQQLIRLIQQTFPVVLGSPRYFQVGDPAEYGPRAVA